MKKIHFLNELLKIIIITCLKAYLNGNIQVISHKKTKIKYKKGINIVI